MADFQMYADRGAASGKGEDSPLQECVANTWGLVKEFAHGAASRVEEHPTELLLQVAAGAGLGYGISRVLASPLRSKAMLSVLSSASLPMMGDVVFHGAEGTSALYESFRGTGNSADHAATMRRVGEFSTDFTAAALGALGGARLGHRSLKSAIGDHCATSTGQSPQRIGLSEPLLDSKVFASKSTPPAVSTSSAEVALGRSADAAVGKPLSVPVESTVGKQPPKVIESASGPRDTSGSWLDKLPGAERPRLSYSETADGRRVVRYRGVEEVQLHANGDEVRIGYEYKLTWKDGVLKHEPLPAADPLPQRNAKIHNNDDGLLVEYTQADKAYWYKDGAIEVRNSNGMRFSTKWETKGWEISKGSDGAIEVKHTATGNTTKYSQDGHVLNSSDKFDLTVTPNGGETKIFKGKSETVSETYDRLSGKTTTVFDNGTTRVYDGRTNTETYYTKDGIRTNYPNGNVELRQNETVVRTYGSGSEFRQDIGKSGTWSLRDSTERVTFGIDTKGTPTAAIDGVGTFRIQRDGTLRCLAPEGSDRGNMIIKPSKFATEVGDDIKVQSLSDGEWMIYAADGSKFTLRLDGSGSVFRDRRTVNYFADGKVRHDRTSGSYLEDHPDGTMVTFNPGTKTTEFRNGPRVIETPGYRIVESAGQTTTTRYGQDVVFKPTGGNYGLPSHVGGEPTLVTVQKDGTVVETMADNTTRTFGLR